MFIFYETFYVQITSERHWILLPLHQGLCSWLGAMLGIPTLEHLWVSSTAILIPAASASTAQCLNNYSRGLKLDTSNLKRALIALNSKPVLDKDALCQSDAE